MGRRSEQQGRPGPSQEDLVAWAVRRGIVLPAADLYNGLSGTYDLGPAGTALKGALKSNWLRQWVQEAPSVDLVQSPGLGPSALYAASGHLESFSDPASVCASCKGSVRSDHVTGASCPLCGAQNSLHDAGAFQTMFQSTAGAGAGGGQSVYLRPETAQGIFAMAPAVAAAARRKVPFGLGQIGTAWRNEISPGKWLFRLREFEQAELEMFVEPGQAQDCFEGACRDGLSWLTASAGIRASRLRLVSTESADLAHYASAGADIEYKFPFGWDELWGFAVRGSHDLEAHGQASGVDFRMPFESNPAGPPELPFVVEPSLGLDRLLYAVIADAYDREAERKRTVMRFAPWVAPVTIAVLPLLSNNEELVALAEELSARLSRVAGGLLRVECDVKGSIGRRYRRQDELGTPWCISVDHDALETGPDGMRTVVVRERDSMEQTKLQVRLSPSSVKGGGLAEGGGGRGISGVLGELLDAGESERAWCVRSILAHVHEGMERWEPVEDRAMELV